jgi:glycosyltransferase involved in cell wall biosynthesis
VKVCYFGTYERHYPRNRVVIDALRSVGVEVVECHVPVWELTRHKTGRFFSPASLVSLATRILGGYLRLAIAFLRQARTLDVVVVGYIGQLDVLLVRFLMAFRGPTKLVFNPLVSLYDTLIDDRQLFAPRSLPARLLYALDRRAFLRSDRILLDTNVHIDYISEKFSIDRGRFERLFVSADENVFAPRQKEPSEESAEQHLRILFVGKFIPLHGLEYIIRAAGLLQDDPQIHFRIVGTGQLYDDIMALCHRLKVRNIEFIDWIPYGELPREMARAHVCLGIFGRGGKTDRVIPNKVFQGLAVGLPVITGDTRASRELLTGGRDALLVPVGQPGALAGAIRSLKKNPRRRREIARSGQALFNQRCRSDVLGRQLETLLERVVGLA